MKIFTLTCHTKPFHSGKGSSSALFTIVQRFHVCKGHFMEALKTKKMNIMRQNEENFEYEV